MHLWHGKFPFDRFFVFYRWRRQSAHKAKNLKNAAAFNRINTVVEMFSSGYINSTDISCRPTSIGRLSRCTLQSRVEIKFPLRAITCDTLVRLPQNTLCPEVPLLWLATFITCICIFDICHNQTSNGFFPNNPLLVLLFSREETIVDLSFSFFFPNSSFLQRLLSSCKRSPGNSWYWRKIVLTNYILLLSDACQQTDR